MSITAVADCLTNLLENSCEAARRAASQEFFQQGRAMRAPAGLAIVLSVNQPLW